MAHTQKKKLPKPAGLYLFNKSMSFILIKSILVQILRLLTFSFIRKGQRKIKDLDRESSTTGLCPIDAVTVVGKGTSSLRVQSAKREGIVFLLLSAHKLAVITLSGFYSASETSKTVNFWLSQIDGQSKRSSHAATVNHLGCTAKYNSYAATQKVLSLHNLIDHLSSFLLFRSFCCSEKLTDLAALFPYCYLLISPQ